MENLEAAVKNLLEVFEEYLIEKYGLIDVSGNGPTPTFMPASNLSSETNTSVSGADTPVKEAGKESNVTKNISQEESGLETQALDTECEIGKWAGFTFRDMWESGEEGQKAVKVLSMSQLAVAKQAKVVVAYYTEGQE